MPLLHCSFFFLCNQRYIFIMIIGYSSASRVYSLQRYKFMETNLAKNLNTYKEKIPTISRALDAVKHLMKCKEDSTELNVHFNLANNVYSEATVKPEGKVALWLGVNVMLEYSYEEALALLNDNFTKATDSFIPKGTSDVS